METSLKEKIIKLRKEGKSYGEIKKYLGCSSGYIAEICKSIGMNNIGLDSSKKLTDDEIKELKEYYKTHTKKETALKFKVSETTVTKYKECKREELTEEERKIKNYQHVKYFRNRTKERAVEYKGGKCLICGYNRCINAFDFHHLDPKEKDFAISGNCNRAWEKVKSELDKCVMLCSNCHREVHAGLVKLNCISVG